MSTCSSVRKSRVKNDWECILRLCGGRNMGDRKRVKQRLRPTGIRTIFRRAREDYISHPETWRCLHSGGSETLPDFEAIPKMDGTSSWAFWLILRHLLGESSGPCVTSLWASCHKLNLVLRVTLSIVWWFPNHVPTMARCFWYHVSSLISCIFHTFT